MCQEQSINLAQLVVYKMFQYSTVKCFAGVNDDIAKVSVRVKVSIDPRRVSASVFAVPEPWGTGISHWHGGIIAIPIVVWRQWFKHRCVCGNANLGHIKRDPCVHTWQSGTDSVKQCILGTQLDVPVPRKMKWSLSVGVAISADLKLRKRRDAIEMVVSNVSFDEFGKIRILDGKVLEESEALRDDCHSFTESIGDFTDIVSQFTQVLSTKAEQIERQKLVVRIQSLF